MESAEAVTWFSILARKAVALPSIKFIKRGEKVYGPYLYKSVRKGSRVTSVYLGKPRGMAGDGGQAPSLENLSKQAMLVFAAVALFGLLLLGIGLRGGGISVLAGAVTQNLPLSSLNSSANESLEPGFSLPKANGVLTKATLEINWKLFTLQQALAPSTVSPTPSLTQSPEAHGIASLPPEQTPTPTTEAAATPAPKLVAGLLLSLLVLIGLLRYYNKLVDVVRKHALLLEEEEKKDIAAYKTALEKGKQIALRTQEGSIRYAKEFKQKTLGQIASELGAIARAFKKEPPIQPTIVREEPIEFTETKEGVRVIVERPLKPEREEKSKWLLALEKPSLSAKDALGMADLLLSNAKRLKPSAPETNQAEELAKIGRRALLQGDERQALSWAKQAVRLLDKVLS